MKAGFHQDYPASVERLWQVFGQRDYPDRKYQALGISAYRVRAFQATPETIDLDLERTLSVPPHRIPLFVQKFLKSEQTLRYISHWQRTSAASADFDLEIQAEGLPVQVQGKGRLQQLAPDNSRLSIDFDVQASVPLLGHKIEQMIASQIEKSFRDDHAFTLEYLAKAA